MRGERTDKEAYDAQALEGRDRAHEEGGDGRQDQAPGHDRACAVPGRQGPADEPREDGGQHRNDVGDVDLLGVHLEGAGDDGHQRRDGEPRAERGEEADPRGVKGAHVGPLEGEQVDLGGPVVLLGVHRTVVRVLGLDAHGQHVVDGVSFGWLGGMGGSLKCVGVARSNEFVHRDRPENGLGSLDQVVLGVQGCKGVGV